MLRRLTPLALLLSIAGCWDLPDDDAGDRAYVTWATTAILGRSPVSPQELTALMDLEHRHGREALLDTLMQQPEFVDHWDDLLLQQLQVHTNGLAENNNEQCYTEALVPPEYDYALSQHLRTADWSEPFCVTSMTGSDDLTFDLGGRTVGMLTEEYTGRATTSSAPPALTLTQPERTSSKKVVKPQCFEFTMKDVVRASLRTDRMDALLRARLVPLAVYQVNTVRSRAVVFDAYFNRHQDCLECHTTTYSTTDPVPRNQYWDRYVPAVAEVDLEFSAFRTSDEDGGLRDGSLGRGASQRYIRDLFEDVRGTAEQPGVHPWGFDSMCMQYGLLTQPNTDPNTDDPVIAGWGDHMGEDVRILDFVDAFDDGLRAMVDGPRDTVSRSFYEFGSGGPQPLDDDANELAACDGCHTLPVGSSIGDYRAPGPLSGLTATMTAERIRQTVLNGSPGGQMDPQLGQGEHLEAVVSHLVAMQPDVQAYSDPTVAMAHLTALSFAEGVAQHLTGKTLTLAHGFPRNHDQALALRTLSDGLVGNDWSLRYVIKQVAMSELVNRNAPVDSPHDPYELPMLVDPWHDTRPSNDADTITGVARNGQGDLIHRWSIPTLLRKRDAALGWPHQSHHDDRRLQGDLGGYVAFEQPGFSNWTVGAALAWEDSLWFEEHTCESPYLSVVSPRQDVITTLTTEEYGLTLSQAMRALKFRMLGIEDFYSGSTGEGFTPTLESIGVTDSGLGLESAQISEIWNVDLDEQAHLHESKLREYCSVLLTSPQFVLAGLPTGVSEEPWSDPDVPCLDEVCSETNWCNHYRRTAVDLGYADWECWTTPTLTW